ncbi:MAG TPA: methyltransferase domain-containing protein [Bryobacteraceae bacterium]|nr:methyltransferase domain-containing protein [Bryobacteraceae bacterium]
MGRGAVPDLPLHLRLIRGALRRLNISLSRRRERPNARRTAGDSLPGQEAALRKLKLDDPASRAYFEKHLPRLKKTLSLVPPPRSSGRVLELGCYMHLTPALRHYCGFREVRGTDFGAGGLHKSVRYADSLFELEVDLFNAERDTYPYSAGYFELVLVCEVIEHMLYDPMHLLLEARRVLEEGGRILITTPNIAGLTSVARVLHGHDNPQIHSKYKIPASGPADVQHVREYTMVELGELVAAAGFEIEQLFTEPIEEYSFYQPLLAFLEENGYNPSNRGEQTYCVARKRESLPVTRYPEFLYER